MRRATDSTPCRADFLEPWPRRFRTPLPDFVWGSIPSDREDPNGGFSKGGVTD